MKTTVEIDDELLRQAKLRAAERGETLRALLERGLQRELDATQTHAGGYELRDASVGGGWLRDGRTELDWDEIRDEATRWRVRGE
jgi:hypothetical protein